MIEIKSHLKFVRISPKKARVVLSGLRGRKAQEVAEELAFVPKKAAKLLRQVLLSAIANARHNLSLDPKNLIIKKITADQGPVYKRHWLRSRGQVDILRKRTAHLSVVLEEKQAASSPQPAADGKKIKESAEEKKPVSRKDNRGSANKRQAAGR